MVNIGRFWSTIFRRKPCPAEFVGYEKLISYIEDQALLELEGDLIEIGAYMGGGTVKLARLAARYRRRVYVVDTFDPALDETISRSSVAASDVYRAFLEGRSMWEVYWQATRHFDNIITIREDSRRVRFPREVRFAFGFVDGCHQKECVENDFYLVWPRIVRGGVLGFHDYRYDDWPEVTEALTGIMQEHREEIAAAHEIVGNYGISSILLTKR